MPKPATDLEKYLAGEYAEEHDWLIPREDDRELKAGEGIDLCLLKRVLTPFTRKGS